MRQSDKDDYLLWIVERARAAERSGLLATAKSWRDLAYNVSLRPAREIVYAATRSEAVDPD